MAAVFMVIVAALVIGAFAISLHVVWMSILAAILLLLAGGIGFVLLCWIP